MQNLLNKSSEGVVLPLKRVKQSVVQPPPNEVFSKTFFNLKTLRTNG